MSFDYIERGDGDTTVFVLHYMTGTKDSMDFLLESDGLRLILPQGKYDSGHELGGQSWFTGGLEFYDWSDEKQALAILDTTHDLAAFIKAIAPSQRRIVTGMSQGGDLSLSLAVHYPELIAMSVPAAGRLFPPAVFVSENKELPSVHLQHGEADDTVAVQYAREAEAWLKAHDFETTVTTYPNVGHDYSEDMILNIRQVVAVASR